MAGSREIKITILGDDKSGSAALKTLGSTADTTEIKIGGLGKSLGVLGTAGAVALGTFAVQGVQALGTALVGMIGDAQESAAVAAQLAAVLKSTGGAAGMTADEVTTLADSLSALTGIDDEAIVSAQSVLLTFTNIGKEVFPDTTQAVLDLSAAMGQDFQSSAVQVGKALNDPIAGITALTRVGVTFTDQQKDQIKAMVEVGNVAGAQKIILAELAKEFGGSAEAQATNVKKLTVAWGNFKETIGGALLPAIEKVAGALNTMLRSDTFQTALGNITSGVTRLVDALDDPAVQAQLIAWKDAAVEFGTSFNAAMNDVQTIALPALRNLGVELDIVRQAFAQPIVSVLWSGAIQQLSDLNQLLEYYIILTGGTLPNALKESQNASDGLDTALAHTSTEVYGGTRAVQGLAAGATAATPPLGNLAGAAVALGNSLPRMGSGMAGAAGAIGNSLPAVTALGHGLGGVALGADATSSSLGSVARGATDAATSFNIAAIGADAVASATDRARGALQGYNDALAGLNSEHAQLQAMLTPLQAAWDALNVATDNGKHVTAAQRAEYERLAPAIEYLNGKLGVNTAATVDATLAVVGLTSGQSVLNVQTVASSNAHSIAASMATAYAGAIAGAGVAVTETGAAAVVSGIKQAALGNAQDLAATFARAHGKASDDAGAAMAGASVQAGLLALAINRIPSSFTVTAHVDISGALAQIDYLNQHLPHSPAKIGPFSTLPNWGALFDLTPALRTAEAKVVDFAAFTTAVLPSFGSGGWFGANPLGSKPSVSRDIARLLGSGLAAGPSFSLPGDPRFGAFVGANPVGNRPNGFGDFFGTNPATGATGFGTFFNPHAFANPFATPASAPAGTSAAGGGSGGSMAGVEARLDTIIALIKQYTTAATASGGAAGNAAGLLAITEGVAAMILAGAGENRVAGPRYT